MSKKVLELAGRRRMLLALIMATFALGLLFSGWFTPTPGLAQQGTGNPQPKIETTNCVVMSKTSYCVSAGSISLVAPTNSPVVCLGSGITLAASYLKTNGQFLVITTYTNTGNSGAAACPPITNTISATPPSVVTNWWEASVGSFYTKGSGLSASFTPTNCGSGMVFYHLTYQNSAPCDTNVQSAPDVTGSFQVACLTAVSVDASDPTNTIVNYTLQPGGIAGTAHFIAPGANTQKSVSSGNFSFIFNQHDLSKADDNIISLNVTYVNSSGNIQSCNVSFVATVTGKTVFGDNTLWGRVLLDGDGSGAAPLIWIKHSLNEAYYCIKYSIPFSGKTLWTKTSASNITTPESSEIPTEICLWTEKHAFNNESEEAMPLTTATSLPAQSKHFQSTDLYTDRFYEPGTQARASIDAIAFGDPNGPAFLIPAFPLPSNRTVLVDLVCQ